MEFIRNVKVIYLDKCNLATFLVATNIIQNWTEYYLIPCHCHPEYEQGISIAEFFEVDGS